MESTKPTAASATAEFMKAFQQLQEEKREKLRSLYEALDVDKDGKVDITELAAAIRKRMPNISETSVYAQQIMSNADSDADEGITFNEFVQYIMEHEQKLAITFKDLDRNKDGVIDYHEIKRHFEDLGIPEIADSHAKEIIARMSEEGKSTITMDEFQRYFLLYPSASGADIAKHWHRTVFIDIGEGAAMMPEIDDATGWWKHLSSGAVAGTMSRTSVAPLERLKIFLQVYASQRNNHGILSSLKYMLREGGMKSMWRGNGVTVVKIMPESAIKFWSYEQVKRLIAGGTRSTGQLSVGERLVAGSVAGGISQTIVYPLEVLKTRLALRKTGEMNQGLIDAWRTIYTREGWRAFSRGYLPNLIGIVPYAGTELAVYESLKNLCITHYSMNRDPGILVLLGCGVTSSTIAQLVSYPLALVRTRLQACPMDQPTTMRGQFMYIIGHDGVLGLYRGLVPNFMKVLPSVSISYIVYELVNKWLGMGTTR